MNLLKSLLHNCGVVIVGFAFAFLGRGIDSLLGIAGFDSIFSRIAGCLLLTIGFLIRVWATFLFYERQMAVIKLTPQKHLITSGPYRFSRNPLYLGGNVFIFFGAELLLGSPTALFVTVLHLPFVDLFIETSRLRLAAPAAKAGSPVALQPSLVGLPPVRRNVRRLVALEECSHLWRHFRNGCSEALGIGQITNIR